MQISQNTLNAQLGMLQQQRNAALDSIVFHAGRIAELEAENEELKKLVAQLEKAAE